MENYSKGKNVEKPLDRQDIPIPDISSNFLWIIVRGSSRMGKLLEDALNKFPDSKIVIWTGIGTSVGKAITCAEIMKKEYENKLHQITKICYRNVEEYWDPLLPELDQLIVKRRLPMVHICLSLNKLNEQELGYQAPADITLYKGPCSSNTQNIRDHHRNRSKMDITKK
ncbi:unnamed protein product [Ceutorhynchus assimilis]|uniref:DNA/RNA-binding protein Alba-like domain-containing protein n=1 Tax=Ceutorhynchus assimilis TaxID=467358 RepID=A0A9N9QIJ0_9CUCU|nr:unnamed protein product [Ceutorhynchus assimilis]